MTEPGPLHLFEGFGIELEYMIVNKATLDVCPVADQVLRTANGDFTTEVACGDIAWSNELALHLLELKTNGPVSTLMGVAPKLQKAVQQVNDLLNTRGCTLMPTGMHPWMNPRRETRLWPHENAPIYQAFHRIFDCRRHGWANLQSVHLNLPFQGDEEFARLHAAVRLVLPILPALAASSPIADGAPTPFQDYRLEVYRTNSLKIPSITGRVIPERVFTRRDYERRVLKPIYRDMAPQDSEGVLQYEWSNARGAIARFERDTIEIRLLDMQECPRADLAIAAIVSRVIQDLVAERWTNFEQQKRWDVRTLEKIFLDTLVRAEETVITHRRYLESFGFNRNKCTAGELWQRLYESATTYMSGPDRDILAPLSSIFQSGPLSRRILRAVGSDHSREHLTTVYRGLCDCLASGNMFCVGV